jgi:hypothetical protein
MIDFAHLMGLRVEVKNAEVGPELEGYEVEPEDYIAGYLNSTRELAQIAEARRVHQFCAWTEVDHITQQGLFGAIDWHLISDPENYVETINDWSRRVLGALRENFGGKVGVGFSGMPESFGYLDSLDLRGFDYLAFSFYGDVYDDYVTNTVAHAVETIAAYRGLAENNRIETLIIGETALEETIDNLSSVERQQIYHEFFQSTHGEVDGYFLMMFPPNADGDLQVVGREWYLEKI